jgi:hypothetical protein
MTLKLLIVVGGLLALAIGVAMRWRQSPFFGITTDQLSGDWLAEARGREEQQW